MGQACGTLWAMAHYVSPNSLLERGREEEAHRVLARVRTMGRLVAHRGLWRTMVRHTSYRMLWEALTLRQALSDSRQRRLSERAIASLICDIAWRQVAIRAVTAQNGPVTTCGMRRCGAPRMWSWSSQTSSWLARCAAVC